MVSISPTTSSLWLWVSWENTMTGVATHTLNSFWPPIHGATSVPSSGATSWLLILQGCSRAGTSRGSGQTHDT